MSQSKFDNNSTPPVDPLFCDRISIFNGHPCCSRYQDRVDSFTLWPSCLSDNISSLALAGFYYTGRGDRVVCFCCKGGLKDWALTENPWIEHAKYYSNCEYIQKTCSPEFIEWVKDTYILRTNNKGANGPSGPSAPTSSSLSAVIDVEAPAMPNGEMVAEDAIVENTIAVNMCKVCLENPLGVVFQPCGHLTVCRECALQLDTCPICRSNIIGLVNAILN